MNVYLITAFGISALIIVIAGVYTFFANKIKPRIIGFIIILMVFNVGLAFFTLYSSIARLHKILGID